MASQPCVAYEPRQIDTRKYPFVLRRSFGTRVDRPYRMQTFVRTTTCGWCGQERKGVFIIPATEAGERFCSVRCFTRDTFQCYEPAA